VGGTLGTLARYGVEHGLPAQAHGVPWSTLLVNVAGAFLIGVIITLVVERWPPTRYVRPFAAIGFCGGFTTFSTLAVESVQRLQDHRWAVVVLYLVLTLVAGLAATALGITLARGRLGTVDRAVPIADPDDLGDLGGGPR
jgi:CrcB protein